MQGALMIFAVLIIALSTLSCGSGSSFITGESAVTTSSNSQLFSEAEAGTPTVIYPSFNSTVPSTYFGMHVLHSVNSGSGLYTPPPFLLNFRSARLWDSYYDSWNTIETARGTYNWTNLDKLVSQYGQLGVEMTYTFGRTPQWASTQPNSCPTYHAGECYPPTDIAMWNEFVTAIGQRYCGQIKNWELWNEPNTTTFFSGSITDMINMSESAYKILKNPSTCACINNSCAPGLLGGENPNVVFSPPISSESPSALAWLNAYLAAGGGAFADAIAVHVYGYLSPENLLNGVSKLQGILEAYGQTNKPLWSSEGAWGGSSISPDSDTGAAWVSRFMLMHIISGMERFYWYEYNSWTGGGLTDQTDAQSAATLNETGIAWRETAKWLTGASVHLCQSYPDSTWACQINRQGGYNGWIVWNTNTSKTFDVPATAGLIQFRDLAGNTYSLGSSVQIGPSPILLESESAF